MKTKMFLVFSLLVVVTVVSARDKKEEYLRKVLSKLEKIESVSYRLCMEAWEPGDTVPVSVRYAFVKEYDNPQDSTIGASYVVLNNSDRKTIAWGGYDGSVKVSVFHEHKGIMIDDFSSRKRPFRPLNPPFFNYVKNIIRYSLTTPDSIVTTLEDIGEAYHFKMVIHEKEQVEFFGKAYHLANPYNPDPTSQYEVWIDKKTDLPYKRKREMSQGASIEACTEVEFNQLSIKDFNLYDYFPQDYTVKNLKDREQKDNTSALVGTKAPAWILKNSSEQDVSLANFKSKVLLINFTGIGCGPCKIAIPFLNSLKERFKEEELNVVAVESWQRKLHSIQNYINANKINYPLLEGNDEVIKDYLSGNRGVPYYFILDKDRIIRKVIFGYGEEKTDKEIVDAVNEWLAK